MRSLADVGHLVLAGLAVVLVAAPLQAQSPAPPAPDAPGDARPADRAPTPERTADPAVGTRSAELPPLLDRELFFGDPRYSGASISPDGRWISFLHPYRDVMNVWVKRRDEPFDAARPVTADTTRPVRAYFWTEDSERILYIQDKGGNENFHIYAVDPSDAPDTGEGEVPEARDLTPYEDVQARIYAVPEATPGEIVVGLNDRDAEVHDVYRLDLETGDRELVVKNTRGIAGWQTDLEGDVRLAVRQTDDGGTEILRVGGEPEDPTFETLYTCNFRETCSPIRFHEDGRRVYLETNQGEDVDLSRLVLLDTGTGDTEVVESDPEDEVDFGGAIFSDRTDELVATVYVGDRQRIYPRTEGFRETLERLRDELPEGEISLASSTEDETRRIVTVSSDVDPGSAFLYDEEDGSVERLYRSRPDLPSEHLAPMRAIRYEARDGLEIPAYLTLPKGVEHRDLPLVVTPHGGPWSRDTWGYDAYAQFLANRGYAVLQPNFRGSTGYGKEFLNAGNEEWGDAMQDDITDGVEHLVEQGVVDPDRVGIFGGSYGGYATLAGLAFTPDVYAAGASYVGPSNIVTLLESIPPYWGPIAKTFEVRVGDVDDPDDRERLERQSPLHSAGRIDDPLLVIQGANDPRVKKRESDQIVVAARENDVDVRYLVAPEEGHGFAKEDNRLAVAAALEVFFARHLGGRHQEEVSSAVDERLAALRVEADTLSLPDTAAARAALQEAKEAPMPEADGASLSSLRLTYATTAETQGQQVELEQTRTLERVRLAGRETWAVTEQSQSSSGSSVDSVYLDAERLTPVRRFAAGRGTRELSYTADSISGTMSFGGRETPVERALDAPVLSGGPGLETALAGFPLEEGWSATLRTHSPQQQEIHTRAFRVTGIETVQVPAGEFEAFVIEAAPVGDSGFEATFWARREAPHHVVRSVRSIPAQMGGGSITKELTSLGPIGTSGDVAGPDQGDAEGRGEGR